MAINFTVVLVSSIAVVVLIGGFAALISLTADNCEDGMAQTDWQTLLDCNWKEEDLVWWDDETDVGKPYNNRQHENWQATEIAEFKKDFVHLNAGKFCPSQCDLICIQNGTINASKVKDDTQMYECTEMQNYTLQNYLGTFSEVMNSDRQLSIKSTKSVNFATPYDDKVRDSNYNNTMPYGNFINYDHNPPKSVYREIQSNGSECTGSYNSDNRGERLPTMAILAVDHKGPVWSACTTGLSWKGPDNERKSMMKMKDFIAVNQYGKAILENIDCLVEYSISLNLISSVSDYELGFYNLVLLHELSDTINLKEREVLFQYLNEVFGEESYNVDVYYLYLEMLEKANTELMPKFCEYNSNSSSVTPSFSTIASAA